MAAVDREVVVRVIGRGGSRVEVEASQVDEVVLAEIVYRVGEVMGRQG